VGKPAPVNKFELNRQLDELLRLARGNAPRIRGRQEMLDSSAFALNLARKEYMPDFGASFQYQKTGLLYPDYYVATFEVKVPLYFWRKQRLGVEEAATRLVQTRHEYQMTSQEISFGVKDQFLIAKTSERLLAMYEQGVIPQAAASLESALAGCQTVQRFIQGHQINARLHGDDQSFIQRHVGFATSALRAAASAGKVHQNTPHRCGTDGEEVGAVLPSYLAGINQLYVNLIDQSRGLQNVVGTFSSHIGMSPPAQLLKTSAISRSSAARSPWLQASSSCVTSCDEGTEAPQGMKLVCLITPAHSLRKRCG